MIGTTTTTARQPVGTIL